MSTDYRLRITGYRADSVLDLTLTEEEYQFLVGLVAGINAAADEIYGGDRDFAPRAELTRRYTDIAQGTIARIRLTGTGDEPIVERFEDAWKSGAHTYKDEDVDQVQVIS